MTTPRSAEAVVTFYDDDDGYFAWLNVHPNSFILHSSGKRNLTKTGLIMHFEYCRHAREGPVGSKRVTGNAKASHAERMTLRSWGYQQTQEFPKPCAYCAP